MINFKRKNSNFLILDVIKGENILFLKEKEKM